VKLHRFVNRVRGKHTYHRWQVILPSGWVEALGWKPGDELEAVPKAHGLLLRRTPKPKPLAVAVRRPARKPRLEQPKAQPPSPANTPVRWKAAAPARPATKTPPSRKATAAQTPARPETKTPPGRKAARAAGIRYHPGCGKPEAHGAGGPCIRHREYSWEGKRRRHHIFESETDLFQIVEEEILYDLSAPKRRTQA
jgi:hypothetical protein